MLSNTCRTTLLRSVIIKSNENVRRNVEKIYPCYRNFGAGASHCPRLNRKVFENNSEIFTYKTPGKTLSNKYVSASADQSTCWSCEKVNCKNTNPIFCMHCNTIQKPNKDENYFKVIGIQQRYDVDENTLSTKYKNLQKLLHPDKYSIKEISEQQISAEYSSLVNKAYSTLAEPLSRGIYLLRLNGHEISEETQVESAFLHEIMERNEEVENAESPEEILKINRENKEEISKLVVKLSEAFNSNDLNSAKNILIHMKYFVSIEQQIKDTIRRMGILI